MDYVRVALFFGATVGHFVLTSYWLQSFCGQRLSRSEELFFHTTAFGLGSLQALLHVLACTIGISLPAGLIAFGLLHGALFLIDRRGHTAAPHRRAGPAAAGPHATATARELARSAVAVIGTMAITACVLTWLYRASQSLQIPGIDATHYHVPYAINYAHGVNLFGFAATPHLYPMGTSILAAWFFQASADPLLLDLTNLLPFLLLFASLVWLFTRLTDEPGMEWVPALFLLLFTGRLFRLSLFISADLFYTAAFAALFALLCGIWIRDRIERHEWLALALATGMLLSSKPQGMLSAALMIGLCAVALVGRRLIIARAPVVTGFTPPIGIAAGICLLVLGAGGVWLVRNWVRFGSPLAPAGLSLFGITIFPGLSSRSTDAPLSVLADLRNVPGYDLWARFRVYTRDWVGVWPAFFAVAPAFLLADVVCQAGTQRQLSARTTRRVFAFVFLAVVCAVHVYILAGVTFSSLEYFAGQSMRYLLPFFALYPLIMLALLFSDRWPWVHWLRLKWLLVLPALLLLLWDYNRAAQMPVQWNRRWGTDDMLDYRLLPVAGVMVLPWYLRASPWRRYGRYAAATAVLIFFAALVQRTTAQQLRLEADARLQFERQVSRFARDGRANNEYSGAFYQALLYQRQHHLHCARSRFFTISRFDFPVELQDPSFSNVVFDIQNEKTRIRSLLQSDGPGRQACDFVVAVHTDAVDRNISYPAVREADIRQLLRLNGTLEAVGDSGRYRVYYVKPVV